jgi:hypothetical protein
MYGKISKGRESPNCVYVIRVETLLGDLVQKRKTSFEKYFRGSAGNHYASRESGSINSTFLE